MIPVIAAAVAALLFLQGFVRLRRRGRRDLAGWDRIVFFGAGRGVTLFALIGPLDRLADEKLRSAHMAQHVLIGDLGPALMVTALRGPLLVFFLPAAILAPLARNTRVRAVLGTLLKPRVAFTPVAGDAGAVVDQCQPPSHQAVEQGRFADIGPADDGDGEIHTRSS